MTSFGHCKYLPLESLVLVDAQMTDRDVNRAIEGVGLVIDLQSIGCQGRPKILVALVIAHFILHYFSVLPEQSQLDFVGAEAKYRH